MVRPSNTMNRTSSDVKATFTKNNGIARLIPTYTQKLNTVLIGFNKTKPIDTSNNTTIITEGSSLYFTAVSYAGGSSVYVQRLHILRT